MDAIATRERQRGAARGAVLVLAVLLALLVIGVRYLRSGPHAQDTPAVAAAVPAPRPNLLVIMVDDLDQAMFDQLLEAGWLPHIRHHLVDAGLRFDNSYVTNAVCCPSRATYLTGQYSKNHGILNVIRGVAYWYLARENREDRALPVMLQQVGYYTGHIGKYLNGYGMFSEAEHVPHGYDEWYGLVDPSTYDMYEYKANLTKAGGPTELRQHSLQTGAKYQTDQLADWSLEFLEGAAGSGKPFYLGLKPVAPHIETFTFDHDVEMGYRSVFREYIRPAPRHECLVQAYTPDYRAPENPGQWCSRKLPDMMAYLRAKPSFNHLDANKHPRLEKVLAPLTVEHGDLGALERQLLTRMASMLAVDDLVGRLLGQLERDGRLRHTLVVFTSDNGYFYGEHGLSAKLLPYEESIRVPLLLRPPGGTSGRREAGIALNNDLAPTLADYAGAVPLRDEDAFDGRSLRPLAERGVSARRQFMIEHFIESTSLELAAEIPVYRKLSTAVTRYLEGLAGFEFGTLGNLSYPAYKAIKRQVDGENLLYVQWYAENNNRVQVLDRGEWEVDFEEFYDLDRDPLEQVNLLPLPPDGQLQARPAARLGARLEQALARLRTDLAALRECKGQSCRVLEDR